MGSFDASTLARTQFGFTVSANIISPVFSIGLEADYPDRSAKPVDAVYPPFVGPWRPIQDWLRANPAGARAEP